MPHWRGWLMATYLSCVVAPWTLCHRPGGKLKKSTSEHGNDYQSNNQSMADSSSSPAPDRTMNNTVHSCGRCVIGTSQQPFICRDCVAETSGQTCKRWLMMFDDSGWNLIIKHFQTLLTYSRTAAPFTCRRCTAGPAARPFSCRRCTQASPDLASCDGRPTTPAPAASARPGPGGGRVRHPGRRPRPRLEGSGEGSGGSGDDSSEEYYN